MRSRKAATSAGISPYPNPTIDSKAVLKPREKNSSPHSLDFPTPASENKIPLNPYPKTALASLCRTPRDTDRHSIPTLTSGHMYL